QRPARELERAARGPLEMRPVPFAGAVVHPFEADVQPVATQALGERRDRKPAPSVMTHGLRDHVDLRPLWEEWPPERKPGEVVEEVAEHRAAPIQERADTVVLHEHVEVQEVGVYQVPELRASFDERRHDGERLVERRCPRRRRGQWLATARPRRGGRSMGTSRSLSRPAAWGAGTAPGQAAEAGGGGRADGGPAAGGGESEGSTRR